MQIIEIEDELEVGGLDMNDLIHEMQTGAKCENPWREFRFNKNGITYRFWMVVIINPHSHGPPFPVDFQKVCERAPERGVNLEGEIASANVPALRQLVLIRDGDKMRCSMTMTEPIQLNQLNA